MYPSAFTCQALALQFPKPYNPAAYEVADLSDSAEHRLLQEIQSRSSSSSSSSEHTQQSTVKRADSTLHYRRDSDSAEETISTLTPHVNNCK